MKRRISFVFCVTGMLVFMSVVRAQDPSGTPGVDYPNYFTVPETSFKCSEQKYSPGFYADLETKCQVFHFCYQDRQESFLCPTGTIFNQAVLTCDVWHRSNCSDAEMFYNVNAGPVMERAGKNLPMLLRLRNRSHKEPSLMTDNVLNKVSSLYETPETPSTSKSSELKTENSDKSSESLPNALDNEQIVSDGHELDSQKDKSEETENLSEIDATDEDMDTNLVYDNINDGYRNYGQNEEQWQNLEPVSEEFGNFYDYKDPDNEYGVDTGDYVNKESFEDSDFRVTDNSGYLDFARRSYQPGYTRVRRKPVYILDQPEAATGIADNLEVDTLVKNDPTKEKQMNLTVEDAPRPEPFPRPTPIPESQRYSYSSTVTPMTSEEFEDAIWRDLILPGVQDDGPDSSDQSDQGISAESEEAGSQSDMLTDDENIYIENMGSESYVPYVSQYQDAVVIPDSGNEYMQSYSDSQQEETDSNDMEDTFVVIPYEYDDTYSDSQQEETHSNDVEDTFVVIPDEYDDTHSDSQQEETHSNDVDTFVVIPDEYDDTHSDSQQEETHSNDVEDTFVVIPDEYDENVVDSVPNALETQKYPEETAYRTQILADRSHVAGYGAYENVYGYSSNSGHPQQHHQTINYNPEVPAGMNLNSMPSDQRYVYESGYEQPRQLLMNYGSNFEDVYTRPVLYPYAENERTLQLPVTEANEDFVYVLDDQAETLKTTGTADNLELGSLAEKEIRGGKQMNLTSETAEEATPKPEPFPRPTPIPEHLRYTYSSTATPMTSEEFEDAIWRDLIFPGVQDDGPDTSDQSEEKNIYIENDLRVAATSEQPEDVYYVLDFDEQSGESKTKISDDENKRHEESSKKFDEVDEHYGSQLLNSSLEPNSSNVSLTKENEFTETVDSSLDSMETSKAQINSHMETIHVNPSNTLSSSNLGRIEENKPARETLASLNAPHSSNVGNFDFSTDSRFLNNMGYSESMDFGPYGFGPNMGQFSMMESMQQRANNPFNQRMGQIEKPKLSPLSAIQEKMRTMKQGKFGAFKKYMSSRE